MLKTIRMRRTVTIGAGILVAFLFVGISAKSATDERGFVILNPDDVKWDSDLGFGVMSMIIQGDPSKLGIYVQRVKFPPHTFSRPHLHPEDRHVTVIKGTWYVGTDDKWDPKSAVPLKPESYMMLPAKAVHWDGTKEEEVIVQVIGYGPSGTTLVNPQESLFVNVSP
jgi:quercetin dioxygenase-like cupin family protein